jgi:hypothetical protein
MKCITGVGFICFGVNINGDCFYGKKKGEGYSVNLKGSWRHQQHDIVCQFRWVSFVCEIGDNSVGNADVCSARCWFLLHSVDVPMTSLRWFIFIYYLLCLIYFVYILSDIILLIIFKVIIILGICANRIKHSNIKNKYWLHSFEVILYCSYRALSVIKSKCPVQQSALSTYNITQQMHCCYFILLLQVSKSTVLPIRIYTCYLLCAGTTTKERLPLFNFCDFYTFCTCNMCLYCQCVCVIILL